MGYHPRFGIGEQGEGRAGVSGWQALNTRQKSSYSFSKMGSEEGFLSRGGTLSDLGLQRIPPG